MRRNNGILVGVVIAMILILSGCAGASAPGSSTGGNPTAPSGGSTGAAGTEEYTSAALPASYENALPASTQLALGILRLEDTPQAVTQAQAKALLPLWEAFQGSALQNQTEQNAVLKQIEGTLSAEQVKSIAAMQLTQDDLRSWMDQQGMQVGPPPGTPGTPGPGGGPFGDMTDEQRAAFQATAEASGGRGGFGNMTDEQRQAFRATAQASGGQFPQSPQGGQGVRPRGTPGPGATGGQFRFFAPYRILVGPLVDLMTARAAG
jgi:hypothetical protein